MDSLVKIGGYELFGVETGRFGLDGGAMFGVVPKPLWEKKTIPDSRNRIPLAARALLLVSSQKKILIDVGLGDKWLDKDRDIYAIDQSQNRLLDSLLALGITPPDITDVLLTHLHFDHAGGSTHKEGNKIVPTFPRATYHVQEKNFRWAMNPTLRDRASYLKDDFVPLKESDQLKFYHTPDGFEHDEELLPGIQPLVCNGHTPGLQMLRVYDEKTSVVYCADTVPTAAHLPVPWVMGYDLEPLKSLQEKTALLKNCREQNWHLFFEHDPKIALAQIEFDERGQPQVANKP